MILETRHLTKSFGKRKAVDDLCLSIPEGSIYGFLGPNGSGKSTTIRMMTALIRPDSGEVFIQGKSVQAIGNQALGKVGALIERPDFYKHLSAKTNLEMLARMTGTDFSRIRFVLDRTGLGKRGKEKVKTYSQGMKQRLGIAQALLSNPKLLILDEPTNGLDPQGMKEVRDLVRELAAEGITVFISSHLLDEVQKVCSHVAMISVGKLVSSGTVSELLNRSGLITADLSVDQVEKAFTLLKTMNWILKCEQTENVIRINLEKNRIPEMVQVLIQNGIAVSAVVPRTSLEDLFLTTIGQETTIG